MPHIKRNNYNFSTFSTFFQENDDDDIIILSTAAGKEHNELPPYNIARVTAVHDDEVAVEDHGKGEDSAEDGDEESRLLDDLLSDEETDDSGLGSLPPSSPFRVNLLDPGELRVKDSFRMTVETEDKVGRTKNRLMLTWSLPSAHLKLVTS